MIDPAVIKELYAQMSDEALINFAKTEGKELTSTAFLLLKEEFKKRELHSQVIDELGHSIILQQSLKERQFPLDFASDLTPQIWDYAFEEKMKGVSSHDIYHGIMKMGIASEYAYFVINNLKNRALAIKKDASSDVSAGYGIIVLGIVVLYVLYSMGRLESIGVVIIIVGIIRLFSAMMRKEKAMKVIENLTEQPDRAN